MLELARYVVLNPVRAGMVDSPEKWPWSSYQATAGLEACPDWLDVDWILGCFDSRDRDFARASYRQFVADGIHSSKRPWSALRRPVFLGSEEFAKKLRNIAEAKANTPEYPLEYRQPYRASFGEIVATVSAIYQIKPKQFRSPHLRKARQDLAHMARTEGAVPLPEIAGFLGVTPARVSQLIKERELRIDEESG